MIKAIPIVVKNWKFTGKLVHVYNLQSASSCMKIGQGINQKKPSKKFRNSSSFLYVSY